MKKINYLLVVFTLILILTGCGTMKEGILVYQLTADGTGYCVIGTAQDGYCDRIVIPSTYEGLPVLEIENNAFFREGTLKEIVIPETITSIRNYSYCEHFENVYYEGTIESWCNISFIESWGKISNPMSVASHFFMKNDDNEWEEVTEIVIPDAVTKIGDYQFYGFDNVTNIVISDNVTRIGFSAFDNCVNLNYNVKDDGCYLGSSKNPFFMFVKVVDTNISSINIDKNTKCIGSSAFKDCTKLERISIPSGVTSIEKLTFDGCSSLTSVTIPNSVTNIGAFAFNNCINIEDIDIPSSVISIEEYAFYSCKKLKMITIPLSVMTMGECVFAEVYNVKIYCEAKKAPDGWDVDWYKIAWNKVRDENYIIWG